MKNSIITECWKPVAGYEGLYEVSDLGKVRSLNYGKVRVLKPGIGRGYYRVNLCKNGKPKQFSVHTLVITTFRGPIPDGMIVNHLNENKLDNRLSNLEICTVAHNNNWGTRNERIGKELKLTNAKSCAKYTFLSSYEASAFFKYKAKETIGCYIYQARKRNENFIRIRREKFYFSQEA